MGYINLAVTSMVLGVMLFVTGAIALEIGNLVATGILALTMLLINIIAFLEFKSLRKNTKEKEKHE